MRNARFFGTDTEYKNQAAYDSRETLFDSIRKQMPNNTSGVLRPKEPASLYDTISTRIFQDYTEMGSARLRLLAVN